MDAPSIWRRRRAAPGCYIVGDVTIWLHADGSIVISRPRLVRVEYQPAATRHCGTYGHTWRPVANSGDRVCMDCGAIEPPK